MSIVETKKWILNHQFVVFVIVALIATCVFTGVSLWLYRSSGAAGLDLSRPGYEEVRTEVKDDNEITKPYSPTGSIDSDSVKDFQSRYEAIKSRLDATNNYSGSVVDDINLGLNPGSEISEPTQ